MKTGVEVETGMGMETGNGVKDDAKIGKMEQNEDGKWSERGYEDRVDGVKWRRE